jgi:hypothetical protein
MKENPEITIESANKRIDLSKLKNRRGEIGNQGFTAEGIKNILEHISGENIPNELSLKEVLDRVNGSPILLNLVKTFLEEHPIEITLLPDDTIHLEDGHHRAFIADQIGMISLPIK